VRVLFASVTLHHRVLSRSCPRGCLVRRTRSTRLADHIRSITTDAAWHIDIARKRQRFRLRSRRLERCPAELVDPLCDKISVFDICFRWGFNDPAQGVTFSNETVRRWCGKFGCFQRHRCWTRLCSHPHSRPLDRTARPPPACRRLTPQKRLTHLTSSAHFHTSARGSVIPHRRAKLR
jgi:hypothetical protein